MIDQFNIHISAKFTGGYLKFPRGSQGFNELFVQWYGGFRPRRSDERWSIPFRRLGKQSELTDHQNFAHHIDDRQVHFTLIIRKNAHLCGFTCQPLNIVKSISIFNTHQHHETPTNLSRFSAVNTNLGLFNPLNHQSHGVDVVFLRVSAR
jgi:hypothetical protein